MRKLKKIGENGIVIATIVTFFALTLSACYFLGGAGFLTSAFGLQEEDKTYYFLSTADYADVTIARQNADLIRVRGGAGYVDLTDGNRIILAVYPTEKGAMSVLEKTSDEGLFVRPITIKPIELNTKDKALKKSVEEALTYFDLAFDTMYKLSNDLADERITIDDVNVKIRTLYAQIEDIKSVFYAQTQDCALDSITEIKLCLVTCLAIIDGVEIGDMASTLSSLRRQTVQLVFCRSATKS
jgi:hypothetical protein